MLNEYELVKSECAVSRCLKKFCGGYKSVFNHENSVKYEIVDFEAV